MSSKFLLSAVLGGFVLATSGCVTYYQNATNTVSIENADMSKIKSYKKGKACMKSILFIFAWGDTLISNAAANGNIKKVHFIEDEASTYIVYNEFCKVVYGE